MRDSIGKYSRKLKLEDRQLIEKFLAQGMNANKVAKLVGCSGACIKKEIKKNSINGVYNAATAHQVSEKRRELRLKNSAEVMFKQNKLKERLDSLEQIIQTLSKLIEELYDKINK